MTTPEDATPTLLRIRETAALVLHRAGYTPGQITSHLGQTTTQADPVSVTPTLLTGATRYLLDAGFTYWGIPEAIAKLRHELAPQPQPDPTAWDLGLLFDVEVT